MKYVLIMCAFLTCHQIDAQRFPDQHADVMSTPKKTFNSSKRQAKKSELNAQLEEWAIVQKYFQHFTEAQLDLKQLYLSDGLSKAGKIEFLELLATTGSWKLFQEASSSVIDEGILSSEELNLVRLLGRLNESIPEKRSKKQCYTIDGRASLASSNEDISLKWELEGKSYTDDTFEYCFKQGGTYAITLSCSSKSTALELPADTTFTLVVPETVDVEFAEQPTEALVGEEVTFTGVQMLKDFGYIAIWDFGNGSFSTDTQAQYTYSVAGHYRVRQRLIPIEGSNNGPIENSFFLTVNNVK